MLFLHVILLSGALLRQVYGVDLVSSTESINEFDAHVNSNPKNICEGEELDALATCATKYLAKLDECKPDDQACECCAVQSMNRDCYGLCPNTESGNFLAGLYDNCETYTMAKGVDPCNLPFKKYDSRIAKFLRPNANILVQDQELDILQSKLKRINQIIQCRFVNHYSQFFSI
ncbi:putative secreted protein [Wickerhamomyces ciferrii]|uniref:Secreted protein n=1 Tax=Wickerhamomyces ciferrii (strain ATCC 14091 / BCRC 22168 / CBS 111 / JCM 3599 / NBRC 0793 / NRRL Y-1031 F-60-10) TaxID=1206466 RepID=K0KPK1_WICCF|nr:uncharacterized protein BN7_4485 [Wickerhamomyces ciferrii]CCH44916.1 putative secreted protein [Wickerhamomyces ciferrii]